MHTPRTRAATAAPVLALAGTVLLGLLIGEQAPLVLLWGGLVTLVAAVPVVVPSRHRRVPAWGATALLAVWTVVSLASMGLYFVPALLASAAGALLCPRRVRRPA